MMSLVRAQQGEPKKKPKHELWFLFYLFLLSLINDLITDSHDFYRLQSVDDRAKDAGGMFCDGRSRKQGVSDGECKRSVEAVDTTVFSEVSMTVNHNVAELFSQKITPVVPSRGSQIKKR